MSPGGAEGEWQFLQGWSLAALTFFLKTEESIRWHSEQD
jgi:hypothetical protein